MSFDSLIDKITDITEKEQASAQLNDQPDTHSKVAELDQSQLAQRARQLEQKLARQRQAKERLQQIEQLVARSEYALNEAEARHHQTDSLHQTLLQLKQQIDQAIAEKQDQLDADREVLTSYGNSMAELRTSKREVDLMLDRVSQLTLESQDVTEKMTLMLTQGHESQQQNITLNNKLQHNLNESSKQQDYLRSLIDQCNETQDRSQQELNNNRLVSEQLLERARATCQQVEQGRLDAEQLIGDLSHSKAKSEEHISLLADLGKTGAENLKRNSSLNNQLEQSLKVNEESRALLMDLQADCRNAKQQATDALAVSESQNQESAQYLAEMKSSLRSVEESRHQTDHLLGDMRSASENLEQKLSAINRIINDSSDSCRESKRLNQESVAVIEQSKQYTQKLSIELESSLKLNEQYQERLQRAEQNYQKTSALHKKYKDLYEESMAALEAKTKLLEDAKLALNAAQNSNEDFTKTVKQFHQCTEQAQKMVLESQQTINNLLTNNHSMGLARANAGDKATTPERNIETTLTGKMAHEQTQATIASTRESPGPAKVTQINTGKSSQAVADSPLLDEFGLSSFADDEFQSMADLESLNATQQQNPADTQPKGNGVFFRIMMVIGLTLSLTFVISSAFKASAAVHDFSGDRLDGGRSLTLEVPVGVAKQTDNYQAPFSVAVNSAAVAVSAAPTDPSTVAAANKVFQPPLKSSEFSANQIDYVEGSRGISVRAISGSAVLAVSDGKIIYVDDNPQDYGKMVMIKHNERLVSVYRSHGLIHVKEGDLVDQGQLISNVGNSPKGQDSSLYFEVRHDGKAEDPFSFLSNYL